MATQKQLKALAKARAARRKKLASKTTTKKRRSPKKRRIVKRKAVKRTVRKSAKQTSARRKKATVKNYFLVSIRVAKKTYYYTGSNSPANTLKSAAKVFSDEKLAERSAKSIFKQVARLPRFEWVKVVKIKKKVS